MKKMQKISDKEIERQTGKAYNKVSETYNSRIHKIDDEIMALRKKQEALRQERDEKIRFEIGKIVAKAFPDKVRKTPPTQRKPKQKRR